MIQQQPYPVVAPKNGLGTAGFVLGLIGLIFAPIPLIGVVAWPLVITGLVLSAVGIGVANKGEATNKGLAIAGVVLSTLGLLVCIAWVTMVGAAFTSVVDEGATTIDCTAELAPSDPGWLDQVNAC